MSASVSALMEQAIKKIDELRREKDELLEALQAFIKLVDNDTILTKSQGRAKLIACLSKANTIIAKATGSAK